MTATGWDFVDGLLTGVAWGGPTIFYSFPTTNSVYNYTTANTNLTSNFSALTSQQMDAVNFALNDFYGGSGFTALASAGFSVEGFTNLNITLDSTPDTTSPEQIRFGNVPSTILSSARVADFPGSLITAQIDDDGDVWFGGGGDNPTAGNYDWLTTLHEVGHALGLKHGHETSGVSNTALPSPIDSMEYSVMTYRSYVGGPVDGYSNETWGYAQSFMMLDILALQQMYGADYSTNSGNTVYSWDPTSGDTLVNGEVGINAGGNKIFATIWDGGGIDTYDLSAYSSDLYLDLQPGGHSIFSDAQIARLGPGEYSRGNIFNAFPFGGDTRSLIENAIGGSGDDRIIGNGVSNKLLGRSGADEIDGLRGHDTLRGGSGNDTLDGGRGNDTLLGNADRDKLIGGNGSDILKGGSGNDVVNGTKGNLDKMWGQGGRDAFIYRDGFGADRIMDFEDNRDTIRLDDNLWVGNLSVQQVLNQFATDTGNNILLDFGGGDTLLIRNVANVSMLLDDITII
ncbi:M10 family metallopeptidase [Alterinioella nitratireducens]|uniref:M10 family metallopeptidase n=1 Tax=Alterinioella nitratireducens TaxID=2735915 RepID=UPI00405901AD